MSWNFPPYPENWDALRQVVLERDGYCCRRCGASVRPLQVDHIVPLSRGGSNRLTNLQTLCLRCHSLKHPHMRARYNARHRPVGLAGLVSSLVLTFGVVIFGSGLFDILNAQLLPVGSWSPGAPSPPLEYVDAFPEPLTMIGGFVLMMLGIVTILLNPSRSFSRKSVNRQSFKGASDNLGPDDEALQAGLAFGSDEGIAMTYLFTSGDDRDGNPNASSAEKAVRSSGVKDEDEEDRRLGYTFQICLNCGADLRPGARVCPKCGRAP